MSFGQRGPRHSVETLPLGWVQGGDLNALSQNWLIGGEQAQNRITMAVSWASGNSWLQSPLSLNNKDQDILMSLCFIYLFSHSKHDE